MNGASLVRLSVRLVGSRIWNEREARRNESETRCWLTSQTVPWLLVVTRSHNLDRSLDPEPLALACEPTQSQWKKQCELSSSK